MIMVFDLIPLHLIALHLIALHLIPAGSGLITANNILCRHMQIPSGIADMRAASAVAFPVLRVRGSLVRYFRCLGFCFGGGPGFQRFETDFDLFHFGQNVLFFLRTWQSDIQLFSQCQVILS
ncbi:MAG: hypothetical protein GY952_00060 [Rhodobacteraceae bacterium]|nr:hypothetical protein [Paracoccaceae bacterium]